MNGPNNLEFHIIVGLKGFDGTNTLAYFQRNLSDVNTAPGTIFTILNFLLTHEWAQ